MNDNIEIGISDIDLENIVDLLKKNHKVKEAVLFGSRAKGNYSDGSDIDISIKGEDLTINDVLDFQVEYDQLLLPYTLDLIIHDRITENALLEHIHRVGIELFKNEKIRHFQKP